MTYEITIFPHDDLHQGQFDSPQERFESAVSCSCTSVNSILEDKFSNSHIDIEHSLHNKLADCKSKITITNLDPLPSEEKLEELLEGSFCSENGRLYPEFKKILIKTRQIVKSLDNHTENS